MPPTAALSASQIKLPHAPPVHLSGVRCTRAQVISPWLTLLDHENTTNRPSTPCCSRLGRTRVDYCTCTAYRISALSFPPTGRGCSASAIYSVSRISFPPPYACNTSDIWREPPKSEYLCRTHTPANLNTYPG
jgi:hypothetical protein